MRVVVLAGGEGTRLRPLTSSQPKPMLPIVNRPLLDHLVDHLRRSGFVDIVMALAFRSEAVRHHFGDGSDHGVAISYVIEDRPLGTAGAVARAMAGTTEPFLVVSGDVLTDIDLQAVAEQHLASGAEASVVLQPRSNPFDFGMVILSGDGRQVERFVEKPTRGQVLGDAVNTGLYVLEPSLFNVVPAGRPVDFAGEVFPRLIKLGRTIHGITMPGYWEDVGTPEAYVRANLDALGGRVRAEIPGFALADGIWLGEGADIDPEARVIGPAVIGPHTRIEAGAQVGPDAVLGSNVRVSADVSIERSVVHDNVYVGPGGQLRGAVAGRGSALRRGASMEDGTVLGEDCLVGEHATLRHGVVVYPGKTVDAGAVVNQSIIWGSRGSRHLFRPNGVSGLANVDITPELAVTLAMAFATTMPHGARVAVSRDTSRAARVLLRAVLVGLNAAGVDVVDLEVATVPVTRFAVAHERCQGGVTVRIVGGDPQSIAMRLFGPDGIDVDEEAQRRIQRIFERRDVRRSLAGEIGDSVLAGRISEDYTAAVTDRVEVDTIKAAGGKVVLDYSYGAASFVMPNVLSKLGLDVLSVNPYASTRQALSFDRVEHAAEVSRLVVAAGAELGAVIDSDGERVTFVDDHGRVLSDDQGLLVVLRLVLDAAERDRRPSPTVVLPVGVSRVAQDWCQAAGARLVLTGMTTSALLETAAAGGVAFGASLDGGYVFPAFLAGFDAVHTLVAVLALLAGGGRRLSELVEGLPPTGLVRSRGVAVPWEHTGPVMRTLLEGCAGLEVVLVDGVKVVYPDGWALVVPDAEIPLLHVWAEAASVAAAESRADDYAARVTQALNRADVPSLAGSDSSMFGA